jgi:hypothetical protein
LGVRSLFLNRPHTNSFSRVSIWVMDRKHLAAATCVILMVAFYFAFTRNKGVTRGSGQANVVSQGGTVTLAPKDGFAQFVVVADLASTNTQGKTSSNAVAPKPR